MITPSEILDLNIESSNLDTLALIRDELHTNQFLFSTNCGVLYQWGKIEKKLKMPHLAEGRFKKALLLQHEHIESMRELGLLYAESERLNDALILFATIVTIDPQDWEAWHTGGSILHTMQKTYEALEWIKMAKKTKSVVS